MASSLPIIPISLPTPFPIGPVTAYLVRSDPITLIDTGVHSMDSAAALDVGLKAEGLTVRDIRRILITHAHTDHYGQAALLQESCGAEIFIHPDEEGKMMRAPWWVAGCEDALTAADVPLVKRTAIDQGWQYLLQWMMPLKHWFPLSDGQRFRFESGELQAIHLPGHALGHVGFLEPISRVLIGGDHLLDGVTPNPIMEPVQPGHAAAPDHAPARALTLGLFLEALERVTRMPISQVLPGHGATISDHAAVSERYRLTHESRLTTMRQQIAGGSTVFALTSRLYPRVRGFDIFLAVSAVLAHLDLLVARGQALVARDGGADLYHPC